MPKLCLVAAVRELAWALVEDTGVNPYIGVEWNHEGFKRWNDIYAVAYAVYEKEGWDK